MKTINSCIKLVFIGLLISATSCKKEVINPEKKKTSGINTDLQKNISSTNPEQLYYYSQTNNEKYNHRIVGKDETGKNVKGYINLETEIGIGIVKKEDEIKEIEIVSENINSRRIIATDINGFQYRLKLDEE